VVRFADYREKFARTLLRTTTGRVQPHFAPRALIQLAIPKSGLLAITTVAVEKVPCAGMRLENIQIQ
jgi:hypothetical protein